MSIYESGVVCEKHIIDACAVSPLLTFITLATYGIRASARNRVMSSIMDNTMARSGWSSVRSCKTVPIRQDSCTDSARVALRDLNDGPFLQAEHPVTVSSSTITEVDNELGTDADAGLNVQQADTVALKQAELVVNLTSSQSSLIVEGLEANTEYTFEVTSSNILGKSRSSSEPLDVITQSKLVTRFCNLLADRNKLLFAAAVYLER